MSTTEDRVARDRTELDDWRQAAEVEARLRREYHDMAARLRSVLNAPLSSDEMRLVDKHCDWIAFQHAWNAVMKARRIKAGVRE